MIVSMDMIISTASYYCGWSHKSTFQKYSGTVIWIWRGGKNQKLCSVSSLEHSRFDSKSSHNALLSVEENQNRVTICSLVLPHIESNSSRDPKTIQNWLFYWNNSITIKKILTSESFFVVCIKNYITKYIQIWTYGPNLCQNVKIWNPSFSFSRALTCADD